MIDIIKVELYRLKKSKIFWILLGLSAACPLLQTLLSVLAYLLAFGTEGNVLEMLRGAGITKLLLQDATIISNDVTLLTVIATAVVLSKEFADGTARNVILANKSRTEMYFAYMITSLFVAITYLAAFFAVTLVVIAPVFGFGGASAGKVAVACFSMFGLGLLASIFMITCVCMFLFGVRKQWATILFPLLIWFLVPTVFSTVVNLISMSLLESGQTLPLALQRWIPFVNMQFCDPLNIDGAIAGINVMYLTIFSGAFTATGYYTFKNADLK